MVIGFKPQFVPKILAKTKIHTVREDSTNRWKPGMKMHMATGVRTANYNQFAEGMCEMVVGVKIIPRNKEIVIFNKHNDFDIISTKQISEFIINDGFDREEDFWNWFNEYTIGKLIYWGSMNRELMPSYLTSSLFY